MANKAQKLPFDPETMIVMIVDDQDPIRKALRRVISSLGFSQIIECFDGQDAAKYLAKTQVDFVITDIYMRKISGFQLLKKIRSRKFGSDIPVIIVTGEGSKEDIVKASDYGADDYILKPFQISDVEKKVISVLTKYHSPPPLLKLVRQGERLMQNGHFQDALKLFEAAERLDNTSPQAILCKALALEKMGQVSEALSILKASAANNSTYYKNYAAMADIYIAGEHAPQAIEALKNEFELNPKQPARQCLLANMLLKEGDFLGAINHFREALKENPKIKDALIGIGRAFEMNGNHDKAIYYFKRCRRYHPGMTKALDLIVQAFERQGDATKALPTVLDEVRQFPTRSDARIIAAQLYVRKDEVDRALKVIDDGLLRDQQDAPLLKMKGRILMQTHDYASAVHIYQRVITIEPTDRHYLLLGLALMNDQKYPAAYQALFSALKDSSDRQKVLTLIAEVLKRSGNILQASTILSIAKASGGSIPIDAILTDLNNLMKDVKYRRGRQVTHKQVS